MRGALANAARHALGSRPLGAVAVVSMSSWAKGLHCGLRQFLSAPIRRGRKGLRNEQPPLQAQIHSSATNPPEDVAGAEELRHSLQFGEIIFEESVGNGEGLSPKDQALVQLYTAACNHYWNLLPDLAQRCYDRGVTESEMWGAVRHLIVFAGYASCLAATIKLREAGLLRGEAPGKVGGPPGNAFELVYDKVTDVVRGKLHGWDPVLAEYIRVHLYGDVYSSPGLSMRQKQMMNCGFLGEANMHDQLYTHLIAAMRFGATRIACEQAVKIGFHMSPRPSVVLRPIQRGALREVQRAHEKFARKQTNGGPAAEEGARPPLAAVEPTVHVPDPSSIRIPPLPPPSRAQAAAETKR